MKKLLSLIMVVCMVLSLTVVAASAEGVAADKIKVGFIFIGDENEGYTYSHLVAAQEMQKALGLSDDQIIIRYNIPESEACYEAAVDLAEQGCNIIFANSFGHEDYLFKAAAEYPEIQFCHATGTKAASSGLTNTHNYFTAIYEARYISGVVGGMKLQSMIDDGTITADQAKVGYVGAYPYAEVVSGYTAFFLGVRAMCPSATMEVVYTNSWADAALEKEAAESMIADGCKLIGQHADTTGASTACEPAGVPIVGYNISMIPTAPTMALTSSTNNWVPYVTYAVKSVLDGTAIDVDWCKGFSEGAVALTDLNKDAIAAGTEEKVAELEKAIADGTLHVFDTSTFTVGGETMTTFDTCYGFEGYEMISDGYFHESELRSAPTFELRIDGITEK
ncbi:MAG: BMP family ABC transporter substrate-binding protein [Eubacteriales bacterium]|nr:BMP family ABC transporter substrate-binding protein [Eubacteriales bacterium]